MNVEKTATTELSLEACLFAKKQFGSCSKLALSSSGRGEAAACFLLTPDPRYSTKRYGM